MIKYLHLKGQKLTKLDLITLLGKNYNTIKAIYPLLPKDYQTLFTNLSLEIHGYAYKFPDRSKSWYFIPLISLVIAYVIYKLR